MHIFTYLTKIGKFEPILSPEGQNCVIHCGIAILYGIKVREQNHGKPPRSALDIICTYLFRCSCTDIDRKILQFCIRTCLFGIGSSGSPKSSQTQHIPVPTRWCLIPAFGAVLPWRLATTLCWGWNRSHPKSGRGWMPRRRMGLGPVGFGEQLKVYINI